MAHSLRCIDRSLTFPAMFGPAPEGSQGSSQGPGPTTVNPGWQSRRDTGLAVVCLQPVLVTQHKSGAPDHRYSLPAGGGIIVFSRDGTGLTFETPAGGGAVAIYFHNVSVDALKKEKEE